MTTTKTNLPILVLTTAPDHATASMLARALTEDRLIACANIVPGILSFFYWQDKICQEQECLLLLKTTEEKFTILESKIKQLHPYQVPEIIAMPITNISSAYLTWLQSSIDVA